MNTRETQTILGSLIQINPYCTTQYHDFRVAIAEDPAVLYRVEDYIRKLDLDFDFVIDIIEDEYGSSFFHNWKGTELKNLDSLCSSDYDYVQIEPETGRVGIWCEVDGFVAWLDEYKKVWIVSTREEIDQHRKEMEEWFKKKMEPLIQKMVENMEKDLAKPHKKNGKVKIKKIKCKGFADYAEASGKDGSKE